MNNNNNAKNTALVWIFGIIIGLGIIGYFAPDTTDYTLTPQQKLQMLENNANY